MGSKFEINLSLLINNFKAAAAAHQTDSLAAVVFGFRSTKTIANVFCVPREAAKIERAIAWLRLALPADVELLGCDEPSGAEVPKFPHLKLNAANLKSMSAQKLATRMLTVKANETLSVPREGVNLRVHFKVDLPADDSADISAQLDVFRAQLQTVHFVEAGGALRIDPKQTGSSLKAAMKNVKKDSSTQKTFFCIPTAGGDSVDELSIRLEQTGVNTRTFEFHVLMRVSAEISDHELHAQIGEQAVRVLEQARSLFKAKGTTFDVECLTFQLPGYAHFTTVVLPVDAERREEFVEEFAGILNLPHSKWALLSNRALQLKTQPENGLLINPHEFVKTTPIGQTAVVSGVYHYHHYTQDNFDDSGWGCAYRSFQTICSWLGVQQHTEKPVPSHKEIQQCLVDIGDKPAKFVGSSQWIGSTELSFCLDTMFGITSRILTTNSGTEVVEHARQLLFHFENGGGPVMIGGGQLAHTILGLDYNTKAGDCRYLVLDPHYTGDENLERVLAGGWCGWKAADFWKKGDFYNLLLPLTAPLN